MASPHTLLGEPSTPEELAERRLADEATDAARAVLELVVDIYAAGEVPFEAAVRWCTEATSKPHVVLGQKMLGVAVQALVKANPKAPNKRGQRPRPKLLMKLCHDLVNLARTQEGLPITRATKAGLTAYERAAEILKLRGIKHMTPAAVRKARDGWLTDPS